MTDQSVQSLDPNIATGLLREGFIDRQQQSGSLMPEQINEIRAGKQDQSIGFDDAVYAMTNADRLWDKHQQQGDGGTSFGDGEQRDPVAA